MRNQCSKFSDGFTLLEVLIGALILAGVMIGISRVSISALTGTSIEKKRSRIEADSKRIDVSPWTPSQLLIEI